MLNDPNRTIESTTAPVWSGASEACRSAPITFTPPGPLTVRDHTTPPSEVSFTSATADPVAHATTDPPSLVPAMRGTEPLADPGNVTPAPHRRSPVGDTRCAVTVCDPERSSRKASSA